MSYISTPPQQFDYFNFLMAMTGKEIKARYKNAFLGFLWIILNPLFQMLVIGFVFQYFVKMPLNNYYLLLFTGLLPWNFFSYSLNKATSSLVYERSLIQKTKFPHEVVPFSIVLSNFFHFLISTSLLILFLIVSGNLGLITSPVNIILLIFSLIWILALTCGISLLTSSLNVKYRDINFFVQAILILWFYATPIIYPLQLLPANLKLLFQFNPLVYPLDIFRHSLIGSSLPSGEILFGNLLITMFILVIGVLIFKRESKFFSDWL